MLNKEKIYITGHRHPDTDSIASAIAYAKLKQRQGFHAIACRLGPVNAETEYLLERFHMDLPMLFEDARAVGARRIHFVDEHEHGHMVAPQQPP